MVEAFAGTLLKYMQGKLSSTCTDQHLAWKPNKPATTLVVVKCYRWDTCHPLLKKHPSNRKAGFDQLWVEAFNEGSTRFTLPTVFTPSMDWITVHNREVHQKPDTLVALHFEMSTTKWNKF